MIEQATIFIPRPTIFLDSQFLYLTYFSEVKLNTFL